MERAHTSKLMQSVDISISTVRTKSVKTSASYYEACANAKNEYNPSRTMYVLLYDSDLSYF